MGKILKISDYKENEAVINRGHRRAVARQNLAALCSVLPPTLPPFNPSAFDKSLDGGLTNRMEQAQK